MNFLKKYLEYKSLINIKVYKATKNKFLQDDLRQECYFALRESLNNFDKEIPNAYSKKGKAEWIFVNNRLNWTILRYFTKNKKEKEDTNSYIDYPNRKQYSDSTNDSIREKEIIDLMYEILETELEDTKNDGNTFEAAKKILDFKLNPPETYHNFTKKDIAEIFKMPSTQVQNSFKILRQVFDIAKEV